MLLLLVLALVVLVKSWIGQPFNEKADKSLDALAQVTMLLGVLLIVPLPSDHFGSFKDIVPDDRLLAQVHVAVVRNHLTGRQVHTATSRAGNGLHGIQWTLGSMVGELGQGNSDYATMLGKVALHNQLANEVGDEFGRWSNIVQIDLEPIYGARWWLRIHAMVQPLLETILAEQVATLDHLEWSLEHAEANAADHFVVHFRLESLNIVAHFRFGLVWLGWLAGLNFDYVSVITQRHSQTLE